MMGLCYVKLTNKLGNVIFNIYMRFLDVAAALIVVIKDKEERKLVSWTLDTNMSVNACYLQRRVKSRTKHCGDLTPLNMTLNM